MRKFEKSSDLSEKSAREAAGPGQEKQNVQVSPKATIPFMTYNFYMLLI